MFRPLFGYRMNFRVERVLSRVEGGGAGGGARLGGQRPQAGGAGAWGGRPPTAASAVEPLGCSASVDFRNVLVTL